MNNWNPPYKYRLMNDLNAASCPSTIHLRDNKLFEFYAKYLMQEAMSVIDIDVPDNWDKDYLITLIYQNGFTSVIKTDEFGIIPQRCTLSGYNVYYHPKTAIISNPLLPNTERLEIGKECTVIKLMPEYESIWDIVNRYAAMLALCDECSDINTFNSKLSYVFAAKDKGAAQSFKAMFDLIGSGEPAVAVGKSLFDEQGKPLWNAFAQNLSANFIAPEILLMKQKIKNEFDTLVGIPNSNIEKKAQIISDEVNANNVDTMCHASLWLDCLNTGIDETLKLFPELTGQLSYFRWRVNPADQFGNLVDNGGASDNATID